MDKKIYGIVGSPVGHSLSPAMQNAAFRHLKIDAEYHLFEVPPGDLVRFLDRMKLERNIEGLNVTIPHKIKAKEYLEHNGSLDDGAARLGVVNTIKLMSDGYLRGFNTDGPGFYRSIVEDLKFKPEGRNIFVFGSGGAAWAIVMYLGDGPKTIFIFDVDRKKAGELAGGYQKYFDGSKLITISDVNQIKPVLDKCDLVVNATPLGMKESDPSPVSKEFLRPGLYVYDLVYNRPSTQLTKDAASIGAHASSGLGMLLYQGAASFEIWTGVHAPVDVMASALKEALVKQ